MISNGLNPSFDFQLFSVPSFSELFANELGASTRFSSNNPTPYVDYSLNQLLSVMQTPNTSPFPTRPYNQDLELQDLFSFFRGANTDLIPPQLPSIQSYQQPTLTDLRDRLQKVRDEAQRKLDEIGGGTPSPPDTTKKGVNIFDIFKGRTTRSGGSGPIVGNNPIVSDGQGIVGDDPSKSGQKVQGVVDFLSAFPQGAGFLVIGVIVLILLLLFVKK